MKLSQLAAGLVLGFGIASAALAQTTMKISISTSQNSHQGVAIDTVTRLVAGSSCQVAVDEAVELCDPQRAVGMHALHFIGPDQLRRDLAAFGFPV